MFCIFYHNKKIPALIPLIFSWFLVIVECGSPAPKVGTGDDTRSKTIGWKGPETLSTHFRVRILGLQCCDLPTSLVAWFSKPLAHPGSVLWGPCIWRVLRGGLWRIIVPGLHSGSTTYPNPHR